MNFNAKARPIARPLLAQISTIIKLTAFILIAVLTQVSAASYSQVVSIHQKKASVEKILNIISQQTGYSLLYDKQDISEETLINIDLDNVPLEKALNKCLKDQPITYKIIQQTIVLKRKDDIHNVRLLQKITGLVTDGKGQPVPGVTIKIKGTAIGTTTGPDGKYMINADDNATLVFTSIGFTTQEVAVDNRSQIDIRLAENDQALTEVVVVGYGTQRKEELTSAVANVKAEAFNEGGSRNPLDLIQGKVAGLTITRTGGNDPNSGVSIQLRGVTSLTGDRSPLIVIDGIPGGNLDLLQQDDIESMSVLKDGSAAAIYGTRANGGVILVTTKKGKKGPATYDYSTYYSKDFLSRKPDFLDAAGYRSLITQGLVAKQYDHGYSTDFYDALLDKGNLSQYQNLAMSGG